MFFLAPLLARLVGVPPGALSLRGSVKTSHVFTLPIPLSRSVLCSQKLSVATLSLLSKLSVATSSLISRRGWTRSSHDPTVQELAPLLADGAMASAYDEALAYFDQADLSAAVSSLQPAAADTDTGCLPCCKVLLNKDRYVERNRILAIAKTAFDSKNPNHVSMLLALFKAFTGEILRPDEVEGKHWERVGFQGANPGNATTEHQLHLHLDRCASINATAASSAHQAPICVEPAWLACCSRSFSHGSGRPSWRRRWPIVPLRRRRTSLS